MKEIPIWKQAPFIRLIIPLIIGILIEWKFQVSLLIILSLAVIIFATLLIFRLLPLSYQFIYDGMRGTLIFILLFVAGLFFTRNKDIRYNGKWFQDKYHDSDYIIIKINEPPIEKPRSFKAEGMIQSLISGNDVHQTNGKVLLYFKKDSLLDLHYGDRIIIHKRMQRIRNSGIPGGFDFAQFSAFHQIYHQCYLTKKDWIKLKGSEAEVFTQFIYSSRDGILNILKKNIGNDEKSLGIAEALLIGYTRDLDKDLVQAYSNTGVVHIIAISGLHLGLIYVMLLWIVKRLPFIRRSGISKMILILGSLWLFSFLTGASASVLRSAVMFTCIVLGENLGRKSSILNSLASSAFILLCYNPFYLWDVGFQLSYLAVAGIIILQKPVYNLLFIKNKWIDKIWQLCSVTIAAQVLTYPVCLYYFHQFPNLFLFTNLIAVPLSSLILFIEILLICIAWIPYVGPFTGKLCAWLINCMNNCISWFNHLSFSVTSGIHCSLTSTVILYIFTIGMLLWFFHKRKFILVAAMCSFLAFVSTVGFEKWNSINQKKIMMYNNGASQSIDMVNGNFISHPDGTLRKKGHFYFFEGMRIMVIDSSVSFRSVQKLAIDLVVISKNAKISIEKLASVFDMKDIVLDASNSLWKIDKWKKDCEKLHLRCHSVSEQGAFVIDLQQ